MKNNRTIRLTESALRDMIRESVERVLVEEGVNEGWFGDKWNQVKNAAGTAFSGNGGSLQTRYSNAKKNWDTQGELNGMNNLQQQLMQLLDDRKISPDTTVGQLVG